MNKEQLMKEIWMTGGHSKSFLESKTLKELKKIYTSTRTLHNLKLHETMMTDFGICIMRVPSGWIYDCWDSKIDSFKPGTFVPLPNKQENDD